MDLRRELHDTLVQIDAQIDVTKARIAALNQVDRLVAPRTPYDALDEHGRPILLDLLVARANVLSSLVTLEHSL